MADESDPNKRRVVVRDQLWRLLKQWEADEGFTPTELVNRAVLELLKANARWPQPKAEPKE